MLEAVRENEKGTTDTISIRTVIAFAVAEGGASCSRVTSPPHFIVCFASDPSPFQPFRRFILIWYAGIDQGRRR